MEADQAEELHEDIPAPRDVWTARIALSIYSFFLILLAGIGFYILFYVVLLISFLALVMHIDKLETFEIVNTLNLKKKMLLIFIIALLTRLVMLVQDQIITDDILNYVLRGEMMLDGRIPYVDFYGGSKPPLHNLVLLTISGALGAGEIQFRAMFSIIDAMIAVLILFLSENNRGSRFLLSASLLYALSPISVITIGLSGHFDPVPAIAVVLSTIFLISRRHRLSSLFLGLGLALKVFGAVLLPYYLWKTKLLKERVMYAILFTIPMGLSLLGLYILSPDGPGFYFSETSGWGGWWSFTHLFSTAIGSDALGGLKVSWIFMGLFLLLILAMYVSIWRKKDEEERMTLLWYEVVVFISAAYLGLMILDGWAQASPGTDFTPSMVVFAAYVIVLSFALHRYKESIFPRKLSGGRTERILIITSLAIILFCFGLPNYAPWYIIWFLPFLLAVRTNSIRFTLLFLLVWHIMGKGVSIFPGLPQIP
ncbi:MAG: glycosyltransferase 87 family protein [Thermoplasmata archaeon]